jgi:minor curlin subunit
MANATSKLFPVALAAILVTLGGAASAQTNFNTTIQEGLINTNDTSQRGSYNDNATYQEGRDNANRAKQRGYENWNQTGQFGIDVTGRRADTQERVSAAMSADATNGVYI